MSLDILASKFGKLAKVRPMADGFERGDAGVGGSSVKPIYSERLMNCYAVTESELGQIAFTNLLSTLASSIGAVLLGLSIDIFKDARLSEELQPPARVVADAVQNLSFAAAIVCFLFAGVMMWRRREIVRLIKRESSQS